MASRPVMESSRTATPLSGRKERPDSAQLKSKRWPNINLPPIRMDHWRPVDRHVIMLPMDRSTGNMATRIFDGKSGAICVAAIAYSFIYPIPKWHPKDVNKILNIGEYLHKATLLRNRFSQNKIRAEDVVNTFYVDFTKLNTLIRPTHLKGELNSTLNTSDEKLLSNLRAALTEGVGCMICYDQVKYLAVWFLSGSYYLFYTSDQDYRLSKNQARQPCCLRLTSYPNLNEFLTKLLRIVRTKYTILTVKILSSQELPRYPDANILLEQKWSDKSVSEIEIGPTMVETDICEDGAGGDEEEDDTISLNHLPDSFGLTPYLGDFEQSYTPISSGRDILRGYNYSEQRYRIPCMNVAAITMLRVTRSFTWTWDTLEEILNLGHKIYENNRAHVDGPEIIASDILLPVQVGRSSFEIECEHIVFGQLLSSNDQLPNLERALQVFFQVYDAGIIQGPQCVAIWQELGYFYMFDAKERDRFGRKWTSSLANEFSADILTETVGCCCATRFRDLTQLINVYSDTVPIKHRRDPFRITRVQIQDLTQRSDNWHQWRGIAIGRWILRGKFYQGNTRFSEENRDSQATCIAAVALAVSMMKKPEVWNTILVNEILVSGDELYTQSVSELREKDSAFVGPLLKASEICRHFELRGETIDLLRIECVINGSLVAKDDSALPGVEKALSTFFTSSTHGILTACETSVAVWHEKDFFYTFDSNARDQYGRNPLTCPNASKNGKLGTSCVLRFATLPEMSNFILGNFELKTDSEFQLSLIEFSLRKTDEAPPMKHYTMFNDSPNAAILRPSKGIHEGNRSMYDLRADKQTLCNILVANCLARLNHSDNWSKKDIVDVLNLGDKMYAAITNEQLEHVMDEFEVGWDHVAKSGISIGNNMFSVGAMERMEGVMVAPLPFVEKGEDDEGLTSQRSSKDAVGQAEGDDVVKVEGASEGSQGEEVSKEKSAEVVTAPDDLKSILEEWDLSGESNAVLESTFFTLGIWKQDRKYFMFDPKARDKNGDLTPKRRNAYERDIRKRRLAAEHAAQAENQENQSQKSQTNTSVTSIKVKVSETTIQPLEPTDNEESENPIETNNYPSLEDLSETDELKDASCIVLRFTELSQLIENISSSVPESCHGEAITLVKTALIDKPIKFAIETNTQSRFVRIESKPFQIIRASLSQNDQIFPSPTNRDRQDAAICMTTLSMATYCKGEEWTSFMLDVILKYGDRLYTKSMNKIAQNSSSEKLNLNQIISPFVLSNIKFSFNVQFFASGDLTVKPGNTHIKGVLDVLQDFFTPKGVEYGVLVARQYYVTVWCDGEAFYLFDSHDIGPDGRRSTVVGVACLYCLDNMAAMADVFSNNLDPSCEFNSFQLYKIKIEKSKLPKTLGICEPTVQTPCVHRLRDPKSNSAYVGSRIMRILHGSISESCATLKWHMIPPTACHIVVAMAKSIEMNPEFWTPRVIDEILVAGNDLYDETLENIKELSFDPNRDRLQPQQVHKDFTMRAGKVFVHMEMDLFEKGILKPRDTGELSLKCAISKFFNAHHYGVIATDSCVVSVWFVCGYFYLFYAQSMDSNGKFSKTDSGACVIRFESFMHLYQAILANIPQSNELDWFELRRCDFTLRKVPKVTPTPATGTKSEIGKPISLPVHRKRSHYQTIKGLSKYTVLRSGPILKSIWSHESLRGSQSSSLCAMAAAMSCVLCISLWTAKTLNSVIRAGLEIYRDARVVHKLKPVIHMHDMPQKITINDTVLNFTIEWPVITESELSQDSLVDFFQDNTMAYLVVRDRSAAIINVSDEFYFFEPMPNVRIMQWASNGSVEVDASGSWVCVLRFKNIAGLLEHIWENNLSDAGSDGRQCRMTLGAMRCSLNYPSVVAVSTNSLQNVACL